MPNLPLIDRQPAINLFRAMLGGKRRERILRLVGDPKMGKTHMLRVYRHTAEEEFGARCALIDLRSKVQDSSDLLHAAVQQLGSSCFESYQTIHDEWARRPHVQIRGLTALLSIVLLRSERTGQTEQLQRQRLTRAFSRDLAAAPATPPIVLLFDAFEQADRSVQAWLDDDLMVGLSRIPHVWVVVAGRTLPAPLATWQDTCCLHQLLPVSLDDHRWYCTNIEADLSDDQIVAFHVAFDGKPGLFVELVTPKFGRRGIRV